MRVWWDRLRFLASLWSPSFVVAIWGAVRWIRFAAGLLALGAVFWRSSLPWTDQYAVWFVVALVCAGAGIDGIPQRERRYYAQQDRRMFVTDNQRRAAVSKLRASEDSNRRLAADNAALKQEKRALQARNAELEMQWRAAYWSGLAETSS